MSEDRGRGIVLSVRGLTVDRGAGAPALREVGFDLLRGEILGVVGQPGSGKTTLARTIVGTLPSPASLVQGRLNLYPTDGSPAVKVLAPVPNAAADLRPSRWERVAMIPPRALRESDPVLTVRQHQADLIVVDHPNLTVEGMRRLDRLRHRFGFAVIVLAAQLEPLREISDELAVMYGGRIVEFGRTGDVLADPHHPYTVQLLHPPHPVQLLHPARAAPPPIPDNRAPAADEVPSGEPGCPYRLRCPYAMNPCAELDPVLDLVTIGAGGTTLTACLQYDTDVRPQGPDRDLLRASAIAGAAEESISQPRASCP